MAEEKKLSIVMFNMSSYSEWGKGVSNRNRHILKALLADSRVEKILAVDYLPHTWKRTLRNYQENILTALPEAATLLKGSTFKTYQVNDKLFVHSSVTNKFSAAKFYEELTKVLKKLAFEDYIAWSYYPLETGYLTYLKADLKIFDAVDNWSEHPAYIKQAVKLKTNYKIIDAKADLIFTVTEELKNLFQHKEKVFWIPNAVDLKHYQKTFSVINRDIGGLSRPVIGYLGTIEDRLDLDLISYIAKNNPHSSLVLVGPVWHESIKEKFKNQPNIRFLGRKTYDEAPMYLQQFDVAIMPHKIDSFAKSTNPMKIFDYLAVGKPVVTTKSADLEIFGDLIYKTNNYQEFNRYISAAMDEDKPINQDRRLNFIKEHSWHNRVEKMLELIYQKI